MAYRVKLTARAGRDLAQLFEDICPGFRRSAQLVRGPQGSHPGPPGETPAMPGGTGGQQAKAPALRHQTSYLPCGLPGVVRKNPVHGAGPLIFDGFHLRKIATRMSSGFDRALTLLLVEAAV